MRGAKLCGGEGRNDLSAGREGPPKAEPFHRMWNSTKAMLGHCVYVCQEKSRPLRLAQPDHVALQQGDGHAALLCDKNE